MRSLRSVYLGLWLAMHVLGAQVPAEIVNELRRAPGIERLGAQVRTWLAAAPGSGESRKLHERFRFRLGVCERRRDCLPQIVHYLLARPGDRAE